MLAGRLIIFCCHRQHAGIAGTHLLDVAHHLLVDVQSCRHGYQWRIWIE
jgi:hypothetical protein